MRMWMIPPRLLCNQHLIAEHGEIHKHLKMFQRGVSIAGRVIEPQIEPMALKTRHDELAEEMVRRGMNHRSPFSVNVKRLMAKYPKAHREARVCRGLAMGGLMRRCPECRRRILEARYDQESR